jgi:tetratricopeptide (TPR) repeat protein
MIFVADRYLLFASLGLSLAVAYAVLQISSTRARRTLIATLVIAGSLRAFDAQSTWRDSATLWQRATTTNPSDGDAWSMYADAMMDEGHVDLAFAVLSRGLQNSRSPRLLLRKALFLIETHERDEGMRVMREAAEAGEPHAQLDLALLLLDARQLDEALVWAKRSIQLLPMHAPARRALGKVALQTSQPQLAYDEFELALTLEPKNLTNHFNVALALISLGREREARPYLEASLRDPALAIDSRRLLEHLPR